MSDSLAQRVASQFLSRQGRGRDDMLRQLEHSAHRADEMLKMVEQQHKFWSHSIAEGKSIHEVGAHQRKIQALVESYLNEVETTMTALNAVDEIEQEEQAESLVSY